MQAGTLPPSASSPRTAYPAAIVGLGGAGVIGPDLCHIGHLYPAEPGLGYNWRTEVTMPSLRAVFSNLGAPMPLGRKVQRIFANNWIKIRTRSSCCGNYGEPGC